MFTYTIVVEPEPDGGYLVTVPALSRVLYPGQHD